MTLGIESAPRLSDFRVVRSYFEVLSSASSFDQSALHVKVDIAVLQSGESDDRMAVRLTIDVNGEDDEYESSTLTGSVYADLSAASPTGRIVLPAVNVGRKLDR